MMHGYPRAVQQFQTSSTILPPLQRNRNYPQGTNGTSGRGYYDQSQGATPIVPSQPMAATDADRYNAAAGTQAGFEPHPGSSNGTPR